MPSWKSPPSVPRLINPMRSHNHVGTWIEKKLNAIRLRPLCSFIKRCKTNKVVRVWIAAMFQQKFLSVRLIAKSTRQPEHAANRHPMTGKQPHRLSRAMHGGSEQRRDVEIPANNTGESTSSNTRSSTLTTWSTKQQQFLRGTTRTTTESSPEMN